MRPSAPVAQYGGISGSGGIYTQEFVWTAPSSAGSFPVLGYRIEEYSEVAGAWALDPAVYQVSEMGFGVYEVVLCKTALAYRVAAFNLCGLGPWSNAVAYSGTPPPMSTEAHIYTQSGTVYVPCAAYNVKIWTIGQGGTYTGGGPGGGLAWKTWTYQSRNTNYAFGQIGVSITSAQSSATFNGSTITATAATNLDPGGYSGGDGGAYGNPGGTGYQAYSGQPYASISYPFTGPPYQYSGNYTFGGGIGGQSGTNPDGTATRPLPVSPCRRHPANDQAGLLSAVALAGGRAVEECVTQAAFGSGAVTFTMQAYGGGSQRVDFAAGYGGGGFDATNPGGAGAVVVQFSP